MKLFFMALVILITGCGKTGSTPDTEQPEYTTPQPDRCPGATKLILDNDNYDSDWLPTLVVAVGMDANCEIDLIGVMINGTDLNDKAGLAYNTVLTYYGIQDRVPIGINHRVTMRTASMKATRTPIPSMDPRYNGTKTNIMDFPSDGLLDSQRPDTTTLLCKILSELPGDVQIDYVTGGHLHNLEYLLRETQECNGVDLVRKKIRRLVLGTGWSIDHQGLAEMNLSEGRYTPTTASDATIYVFQNWPKEVPIIMSGAAEDWVRNTDWPEVGNQYINDVHIDSPMAFILGIRVYGTYGGVGPGDSGVLIYELGDAPEGNVIRHDVKTCFVPNSYGAVIIENYDANHYYNQETPEYYNYYFRKVNALMNQPTQDGRI